MTLARGQALEAKNGGVSNHEARKGTLKDLFVCLVVRFPRLSSLLFSSVLLVAAGLRFAGLDWDRGHFVHPDERRMLMVVEQLHWPQPWSWREVLSPASPLNPRFFAYGSFPLYLLRLLGAVVGSDPARLYLPGRALSAAFSLLTVAAIYAMGRELGGRRVALVASALLGCSVLSIQLAHYLAVDSLLTLLSTLAAWCMVRVAGSGSLRWGALAGALTGLALATKTSAMPLLVAGWAAWALWTFGAGGVSRLRRGLAGLAASGVAAGLTFVAAEPYAVIDWFRFAIDVGQESAMASGALDLPYTRQFTGTPVYLYQLRELVVWSLGAPLGLLGLAGLLWSTWRALAGARRWSPVRGCAGGSPGSWARGWGTRPAWPWYRTVWAFRRAEPEGCSAKCPAAAHGAAPAGTASDSLLERAGEATAKKADHLVILAWMWPYLLATGALHAKFSRYLAPLVPWLCLMAALFLRWLWGRASGRRRARRLVAGLGAGVLVATALYALAFTTIYLRPHPWLAAGEWMRRHVPDGAVLTAEMWDDRLPVAGPGDSAAPRYRYLDLDMYAVDSDGGLGTLADALSRADYVVLASQRLYGAIGRLPDRYPLAAAYYRLLFSGRLGFALADVESSYPRLGPLAIADEPLDGTVLPRPPLPPPAPLVLTLGRADESYSVYDHPRVMVFRKIEALSADELEARIRAAANCCVGRLGAPLCS